MNILKKKDDPHRCCISEITDSKNVVRKMSKKSLFRGHVHKLHGKRFQALFKSSRQHFYHIDWSLSRQLSWKKSLLLTWLILGLLFSTLAADGKYPGLNSVNLMIPIQMQLSQKQKTFFQYFARLSKSRLNFQRFETKGWPL